MKNSFFFTPDFVNYTLGNFFFFPGGGTGKVIPASRHGILKTNSVGDKRRRNDYKRADYQQKTYLFF